MRVVPIVGLAFLAIHTSAIAQPEGGQPDWIEQARLVAAKYGISVGEAVRRARLEIKVNRANERFFNDPDYAGAVILQDARAFRAKFGFKGGKRPDLGDQELREIGEISSVSRSLADLKRTREDLWGKLLPLGVRFAFTEDVETQTLKLYPDDPADFQQAVRESGIEIPNYVAVQSSPLTAVPEYDVYGSGSIDFSGSTDNCTGGFIVTNGSVRGLSTAGHCAVPPLPSTHRGQPIGTVQPGISQLYDGNGLDVGWFRNSAFIYPNRVRITSTSFYTVTTALAAPPAKLTTTCVLRRTNPQVCSTVLDYVSFPKKGMPATDRSDGPYVMLEQYVTEDKDSGAPWLYGGEAHGIHYGRVNDNGVLRSLYSPVSSLPRIGLRVATTP